ncbi:hypothetical protein CRUP_026578 [Coryphaenoides rupestris]|nr:hypothetical protein CRUP_026578 [Coryphaenoides rupestris]
MEMKREAAVLWQIWGVALSGVWVWVEGRGGVQGVVPCCTLGKFAVRMAAVLSRLRSNLWVLLLLLLLCAAAAAAAVCGDGDSPVLEEMWRVPGKRAQEIVREQDLGLVRDAGKLQSVCQRVLDSNPDLRETKGRADPALVRSILEDKTS